MVLKGTGVSGGVAVGTVMLYEPFQPQVEPRVIDSRQIDDNIARYSEVQRQAAEELKGIIKSLSENQEQAKIFNAHIDIIYDEAMHEDIMDLIKNSLYSPEWAVYTVYNQYSKLLAASGDELIKQRATDISDVMLRVLRIWSGGKNMDLSALEQPVILAAYDLFPSDTACLKKEAVLGIVTEVGGVTSHTAILAKSLGIPAVLGVDGVMDKLLDGQQIIVDAESGIINLHPDAREIDDAAARRAAFVKKQEDLARYLKIEPITKDGQRVKICLNVGSANDVGLASANFTDGVGLFRTEFLYMSCSRLPTEEEQFEAYREILKKFPERSVIVRTLDIGGDKKLDYLELPKEDNPFLGLRALRLCFDQLPIFKTQLRACLRASVYGKLKIMFPMVGSVGDIRFARQIVEEVKGELRIEGIPFDRDIQVGIMVEIPSIAIMADVVAKEVDFASIGTNDLCQYLTAVDRLNPKVASYYQSYHPAMFRIIANLAKAFAEEGKELSVCGELGGDPLAAAVFIGLGINKLSMNAPSVPVIKKMICELDTGYAKEVAEQILSIPTADAVEDYIKRSFQSFV